MSAPRAQAEQKFVAECVGKSAEINFGLATSVQWAPGQQASETAEVPPQFPRWQIKESYLVAGVCRGL